MEEFFNPTEGQEAMQLKEGKTLVTVYSVRRFKPRQAYGGNVKNFNQMIAISFLHPETGQILSRFDTDPKNPAYYTQPNFGNVFNHVREFKDDQFYCNTQDVYELMNIIGAERVNGPNGTFNFNWENDFDHPVNPGPCGLPVYIYLDNYKNYVWGVNEGAEKNKYGGYASSDMHIKQGEDGKNLVKEGLYIRTDMPKRSELDKLEAAGENVWMIRSLRGLPILEKVEGDAAEIRGTTRNKVWEQQQAESGDTTTADDIPATNFKAEMDENLF